MLMAGPGLVVIAGFITLWLAISSSDGLVADDYYKRGLVINETIARSRNAEALGVQVAMRLTANGIRMHLTASQPGFVAPSALNVTLSHPTRAGLDQKNRLTRETEPMWARCACPDRGALG